MVIPKRLFRPSFSTFVLSISLLVSGVAQAQNSSNRILHMEDNWAASGLGESSLDFESGTAIPSKGDCPTSTLTTFFGIDGSKQPQDFGANANLGVRGSIDLAGPLWPSQNVGYQIGTSGIFAGNAVQVFELLGESDNRFQSFTTIGLFKRGDNGLNIGAAYDWMYQDSYDTFSLGQWRLRASYDLNPQWEIGVTANLAQKSDQGQFNAINVELEPIDQIHIFLRRRWASQAITTCWFGVADEHSEGNVITGPLPDKNNQFLFGAEIFAPLNQWLALYGETNLMMPADTGAVDAFLGIEFSPRGVYQSRNPGNRFRRFLPVAGSPTFTTNLTR